MVRRRRKRPASARTSCDCIVNHMPGVGLKRLRKLTETGLVRESEATSNEKERATAVKCARLRLPCTEVVDAPARVAQGESRQQGWDTQVEGKRERLRAAGASAHPCPVSGSMTVRLGASGLIPMPVCAERREGMQETPVVSGRTEKL